jgi:hypothetical protein
MFGNSTHENNIAGIKVLEPLKQGQQETCNGADNNEYDRIRKKNIYEWIALVLYDCVSNTKTLISRVLLNGFW